MRKIAVLIFLFLTLGAGANEMQAAQKEYPTATLLDLWLAYKKDQEAVNRFYDSLDEKHLVELNDENPKQAVVTYFAKGSADTDYIMQSGGPDFYGLRFKQLGSSDIYFCVQTIPSDAWFVYGVNEFKRSKTKNSGDVAVSSMQHIYDGAVIGPDAPLSPHILVHEDRPKGELNDFTLNSIAMGERRKITLYQPANYNANLAHNLVIQLDGQNYSRPTDHGPVWRGWTPMPTVLDNLMYENRIAPTVTLFVHNQGNRSGDLISDELTDFIALELVDWARKNYNISQHKSDIIVSGASRGGYTAANTAIRHPDIIGGVLAQSGSFYYTLEEQENWPIYPEFEGKIVSQYKRSERLNIRFYLDVGLYDLGLGAVGTNRQFRDILDLKGYDISYYQYKGGHSHLGWRHTLSRGLEALLGERD